MNSSIQSLHNKRDTSLLKWKVDFDNCQRNIENMVQWVKGITYAYVQGQRNTL